ncbi:hypothetical protein EV05_1444 [Prochlorococcus sp. MIT 0601]|nr:hypothetical protein EV05_1444 [Prochlorococcus sp. MIT 0601]
MENTNTWSLLAHIFDSLVHVLRLAQVRTFASFSQEAFFLCILP